MITTAPSTTNSNLQVHILQLTCFLSLIWGKTSDKHDFILSLNYLAGVVLIENIDQNN